MRAAGTCAPAQPHPHAGRGLSFPTGSRIPGTGVPVLQYPGLTRPLGCAPAALQEPSPHPAPGPGRFWNPELGEGGPGATLAGTRLSPPPAPDPGHQGRPRSAPSCPPAVPHTAGEQGPREAGAKAPRLAEPLLPGGGPRWCQMRPGLGLRGNAFSHTSGPRSPAPSAGLTRTEGVGDAAALCLPTAVLGGWGRGVGAGTHTPAFTAAADDHGRPSAVRALLPTGPPPLPRGDACPQPGHDPRGLSVHRVHPTRGLSTAPGPASGALGTAHPAPPPRARRPCPDGLPLAPGGQAGRAASGSPPGLGPRPCSPTPALGGRVLPGRQRGLRAPASPHARPPAIRAPAALAARSGVHADQGSPRPIPLRAPQPPARALRVLHYRGPSDTAHLGASSSPGRGWGPQREGFPRRQPRPPAAQVILTGLGDGTGRGCGPAPSGPPGHGSRAALHRGPAPTRGAVGGRAACSAQA